MKLLLDECITNYLKPDFAGHEVFTIEEAGLKGLENGDLLRAASGEFEVLITVDKNIPFQQNLAKFNIAVLILRAKTNRYEDLKKLVPQALLALENIQPGSAIRVESSS